jgi:ATP-binding cassette subfamily B protein
MTETTLDPTELNIPALPAWKVIWEMIRFRPGMWIIDLVSVALSRFSGQVAPALVLKAFFDSLTGGAELTFGIWTIAAFFLAIWIGRVLASYGFYYADVPIFAEMNTLLRKNLLQHILKRPGASQLPDSPGEAVSRFKTDVDQIPLFVILINDILVGLAIIAVAVVLMTQISPSVTLMALIPLVIVGIVANLATGRIERRQGDGFHWRVLRRGAGGQSGSRGEKRC